MIHSLSSVILNSYGGSFKILFPSLSFLIHSFYTIFGNICSLLGRAWKLLVWSLARRWLLKDIAGLGGLIFLRVNLLCFVLGLSWALCSCNSSHAGFVGTLPVSFNWSSVLSLHCSVSFNSIDPSFCDLLSVACYGSVLLMRIYIYACAEDGSCKFLKLHLVLHP